MVSRSFEQLTENGDAACRTYQRYYSTRTHSSFQACQEGNKRAWETGSMCHGLEEQSSRHQAPLLLAFMQGNAWHVHSDKHVLSYKKFADVLARRVAHEFTRRRESAVLAGPPSWGPLSMSEIWAIIHPRWICGIPKAYEQSETCHLLCKKKHIGMKALLALEQYDCITMDARTTISNESASQIAHAHEETLPVSP